MAQTYATKSRRGRWTLVAVCLGSGIVFLDSSVVNLALPTIGEELPRSFVGVLEGQTYIVSGYLLVLSALLILAGALTDYHGRKRMFSIGLVSFGATSLLCAIAPTMELLILFRILQGAAGALLVPGSLSIITVSFEGEDRGKAFGTWAAASAATTIMGPFVGGVLVNTSLGWRSVFLINLPLVIFALYATFAHVGESKDEEASGHFDWLGAAVAAVAVGGLAFGAIRGQQVGWQGTQHFIAMGAGVAATIAFPFMMSRRKNPLVPPALFKSRNFTVTNISTFVIYGALYVTFTFQTLFLISVLGYSEQAAGVVGIPGTLFLVLFSTRFGKLAARYGPRIFMTLGPALMASGLLWIARIPADSAPWTLGRGGFTFPPTDYFVDLLPGLVLFGVGLMMLVAPLTTALMTSVSEKNSGLASAINNAISRAGSPIIIAIIFVAVSASFYGSIGRAVPNAPVDSAEFRSKVSPLSHLNPEEVSSSVIKASATASTEAFRLSMIVSALLLGVGAVVNGLGIKNPPKPPKPDAASDQEPDKMAQA